ncbi:MAG: glycosyltransferase family 2 protein [Deltaproteobacteria bacterium]|nr:glycosyltransferase family 2 protein [Deltaproteobacteria bacterium]
MTQHPPDSSEPASEAGFSVVIPAFNEEDGIVPALRQLKDALRGVTRPYEIIVVDDGSTDRTAERALSEDVQVIQAPTNRGYGASLKTGIRAARYDILVITDADGTYPPESIPKLVEQTKTFEMVVGARVGAQVAIPLSRRPAKWFLGKLASYLAGQKIPDLNSGLRAMRRELVERYEHLLPSGFSFTTTITLSALCRDHLVQYETIDYHPRTGDSKIRPRHAFDFLLLIIRTIVYFNPLKVFLPVGFLFFLAGAAKLAYDLTNGNLSEGAIFSLLSAGLVWTVGLLSYQISRVGMRPNS